MSDDTEGWKYSTAVSLLQSRYQLLSSQFSIFITAETILLGVIGDVLAKGELTYSLIPCFASMFGCVMVRSEATWGPQQASEVTTRGTATTYRIEN